MHPPMLKRVHKKLLVEVDVLLIVLQVLLDGSQEFHVLTVAPRVAECEPIIFNLAIELETE